MYITLEISGVHLLGDTLDFLPSEALGKIENGGVVSAIVAALIGILALSGGVGTGKN